MAALLALAGCGQAPPPPLIVGMNAWVGFDPLVLARDRGLVNERRIKLVELASGTEVQRGLYNGLLDAAALTLDEAMRLTDAGMALRVVALLDASHGSDMVVTRPDLPAEMGLRGAFVAVEDSSVGTLMLQRMLQTAGLSRGDIKVVNMDANHHLAALRGGRVDAAVSYAPLSGQLVAAGFKPVFTSREIPGEIVDVLVVRTELLRTRPDAIDEVLRAWATGLQALRADMPAAVRDLSRGTDLSPEAYAEVLAGLHFISLEESLLQLQGPALGLEARAQAVAGALVDVGVLKRPPELRELLDVGPLRRVVDGEGGR
ncbi:MAG: ABC transporter substrate-binding protein [Hydrogenophaga sp.]|nr:ABC transporter substrate-binding protein [Hydrogenophaga sp.]